MSGRGPGEGGKEGERGGSDPPPPADPRSSLASYRRHGRVVLPGRERLKDAQAVKAEDGGHHQVAGGASVKEQHHHPSNKFSCLQ